ncbi:MAG: SRPBCC family protein [Gammaproteobacteria bacterium]|nr:SRPBCC family protein [Gammaproteobacteria bacterium]
MKPTMHTISKTVVIHASPEDVYDLIARVEDFVLYSSMIREIRRTGPDSYHWRVQLAGIPLEWNALVTERDRPRRFAWRAITGVSNDGSYTLTQVDGDTRVSLVMQYALPKHLVERVLMHILDPLVRDMETDILEAIRRKLEQKQVSLSF